MRCEKYDLNSVGECLLERGHTEPCRFRGAQAMSHSAEENAPNHYDPPSQRTWAREQMAETLTSLAATARCRAPWEAEQLTVSRTWLDAVANQIDRAATLLREPASPSVDETGIVGEVFDRGDVDSVLRSGFISGYAFACPRTGQSIIKEAEAAFEEQWPKGIDNLTSRATPSTEPPAADVAGQGYMGDVSWLPVTWNTPDGKAPSLLTPAEIESRPPAADVADNDALLALCKRALLLSRDEPNFERELRAGIAEAEARLLKLQSDSTLRKKAQALVDALTIPGHAGPSVYQHALQSLIAALAQPTSEGAFVGGLDGQSPGCLPEKSSSSSSGESNDERDYLHRAKRNRRMTKQARVLRILEYTGPAELLEAHLDQRVIKGTTRFGSTTIREAIIGQYPEILQEADRGSVQSLVPLDTTVIECVLSAWKNKEFGEEYSPTALRAMDQLEHMYRHRASVPNDRQTTGLVPNANQEKS